MLALQHDSERGKFPLFCLFNFLLGAGYSFGFTSSSALLVAQFGPSSLFPVYLTCSLGSLAAALLFYLFIDWANRRLVFYASFLLPALMVIGTWIHLRQNPQHAFSYQMIRTLYYVAYRLTELEFWYVASLVFANMEAKAKFSTLIAMGLLGDLVGALLVSFFSHRFHTENLALVWGVILLFAPFLLSRISFHSRILPGVDSSMRLGKQRGVDDPTPFLREGTTILLLVFWLFYAYFNYGVDYVFNNFAVHRTPGVDDLAAYFGRFAAMASLFVLTYHLFIGSRLFERFGLQMSLVLMAALSACACGLISFYPSLIAAAAAKCTIDYFVENLALARLHTVLTTYPSSLRGRIRIFCEGFGRPLGTLALLMSVWAWHFKPDPVLLSRMLFAVAVAFLVLFPAGFHSIYTDYLIARLKSPNLAVLSNAVQALSDPAKKKAVRPLIELLHRHPNGLIRQAILRSLGGIGGREAFEEIRKWLEKPAPDRLRKAAVEAAGHDHNYETVFAVFRLMRTGGKVSFKIRMYALKTLTRLMGKQIIPTLLQGLNDPDLRVQADLIEALGILHDRKTAPVLARFLDHPNHRIRANAAVAVLRIGRCGKPVHKRAKDVIRTLFTSNNRYERHAGLYAVGVMGLREFEEDILAMKETHDKSLLHFILCSLAGLQNLSFVDPFIALLLDDDLELARRTVKRIDQFPARSREVLLERIASLSDGQRSRIEARMIEMSVDLIDQRTLFEETWDAAPGTAKL